MYHDKVLAMVLAGGQGKRLYPLTKDRAKPAVPFGGRYRIIDFVLNNFINSGFHKIKVLTQYKSDSLNKHISRGWNLCSSIDQYVDLVPAQMRTDGNWYKGTADAIFQNINQITDETFSHICVFGGDHIYKMDIRQMLNYHIEKKADLTISAIAIPIELAGEYGIIEVDDDWRLTAFIEKPKHTPKHIPNDPTKCLASMGNYIFEPDKLVEELKKDALDTNSSHDFGKNIIPNMLKNGSRVYIYNFSDNSFDGMTEAEKGYWKDVGTIDSLWEANMDLLSKNNELDLHDPSWKIYTEDVTSLPQYIGADAKIEKAFVTQGCVIDGEVKNSVLFTGAKVAAGAKVIDSVLMPGAEVEEGAVVQRALVADDVKIGKNAVVGAADSEHIELVAKRVKGEE